MVKATLEEKLNKAKPILLKALKRSGADVLIYVVSNKEMEKVRKALLGREDFKGREARKITKEEQVNVLAFPEPAGFPNPGSKKKLLGEIYLNYDFKGSHPAIPVPSELKAGTLLERFFVLGPLFIHGMLHLVGYEHWTNRDTITMQTREKKLWAELVSKIS
jgi:ssRNA-specific RNase YbeY (16S rRNA maturation enzyme)